MDVREKLLHNEIQNLGQMVQIVSFELTLVSDFLKEKFGLSYELFRQRYVDQCNPVSESTHNFSKHSLSKKKVNITARKSTTCLPATKRREVYDDNNEGSSTKNLKPNPMTNDDNESEDNVLNDDYNRNESIFGDDDCSMVSSGEENDTNTKSNISITSVLGSCDQIPEGAELMDFSKRKGPEDKLIGRARSNIWKHYIVAKLPNGKLHATCPRCSDPVSCKVERLTNHYRKCIQGECTLTKHKTQKIFKDDDNDNDEDSKRKVAFYIKAMKERRKPSVTPVTPDNRQSQVTKEESSGAQTSIDAATNVSGKTPSGGGLGKGRRMDPVWDFFIVTKDLNTQRKIVKCKRCEMEVSGKAERVRRHFIICHELDKEGDA